MKNTCCLRARLGPGGGGFGKVFALGPRGASASMTCMAGAFRSPVLGGSRIAHRVPFARRLHLSQSHDLPRTFWRFKPSSVFSGAGLSAQPLPPLSLI